MKAIKKLTAILLSVMMLLGLVIIPSSAAVVDPEDLVVTKEYSLFDLSGATVGASTSGNVNALPAGVENAGIERFNNWTGTFTSFTLFEGTQEVVEVDGQKMLKVVFDKYAKQNGNETNGARGVYSIKMKVPAGLGSYVTDIFVDFDDHGKLQGELVYRVGTIGNGKYSTDSYGLKYYGVDNGGVTHSIANYTAFSNFAAATDKWSWDNNKALGALDVATDPVEEVFLIFNDKGATVDGGTGYVLLKDVKVTVTAPESVFKNVPTVKKYSLFDLTNVAVGASTTGDANALPAGVEEAGIERFNYNYSNLKAKSFYSGTQEVVEYEGQKMLKVTFDKYANQGGNDLHNATGVYSIKMKVPAGTGSFIKDISVEFAEHGKLQGELVYRVGVLSNGKAGAHTYGLNYYSGKPQTYKVSDFTAFPTIGDVTSKWSWDNNKALGAYSPMTYPVEEVYLVFSDKGATADGGTGYVLLKDIKITTSYTQADLDNMSETKTINLLDMSHVEAEQVVTAADYPMGVAEYSLNGAAKLADNKKKVVVNSEGKKVLQLDLSSCGKDGNSTQNFLQNTTNCNPIYYIKLTDIPSSYVPYIEKIGFKMKKSSASTTVIYEFGISDGSYYSRLGNTNSSYTSTDTLSVEIDPKALYKINPEYNIGNHAGGITSKFSPWGDDYSNMNTIFLAIGAYNDDSTALGTLDIVEITYTVTATKGQFDAADAEWETQKNLVADFESDGTATEFATGGKKAWHPYANTKWATKEISNPYMRDANGLTFWLYNNGTKTINPKLGVCLTTGERYIVEKFSIAPQTYKKVVIDFSCVGLDLTPTVTWWEGNTSLTRGEDVSLTEAQRASIMRIDIGASGLLDAFVDDIYLMNDANYKDKEKSEIAINEDNVTGATVNEEGKIVIPASAEDQTVAITVPEGSLTNASTLTYKLTSKASASAGLRFYTNAVFDTTRKTNAGADAYIRFGGNEWQHSIAAGATFSYAANFYGADSWDACSIIVPTTGTKLQWPGGPTSVWATASEKAKATTIFVDVKAFGNPENAATDYITLDGLTLVSTGVRVTTATATGGKATLTDSQVFPGSTVEFFVTTYTDCYLREISAVDSTGKNIIITRSQSASGKNLGNCYTFIAPAADVTITPKFSMISNTFSSETAYDGDDFNIRFTTPVIDGKGYNKTNGNFENFVDCGVIVAPVAALEKYGYSESDLTTENIKNWVETGHHLAKYVVSIDGTDILNSEEEIENIEIEIKFTNVSIAARRELSTCIISHANFKDDAGNASGSVAASSASPLDYFAYGDAFSDSFYMGKGINYEDVEATSDPAKMQEIYDNGFDFIRLPMWITLDENNQVAESSLKGYDVKIENALKLGMSVIADLHVLKDSQGNKINISADYVGNVQKYYDAWDVIAEYYAAYPNSVAFQIVNEPRTDLEGNDPITDDEIMEFQSNIVTAIRQIPGNEERKIVIGSDVNYPLNMKDRFTENLLADENIIIDFHYYTPMVFTHSGATWILNDDGSFFYPEGATLESAGVDFDAMRNTMASIDEFRSETGVEVFMGEWGAYNPNYDDKITYYAEMVKAMDEAGIPWAVWGYSEPFSGYVNGEWDETLLDIYSGNYEDYIQQ